MSLIRGVMLAGKFRTQHELNGMSNDDQRNTLIVEMVGRTNQSVGHFQAMDDATLAGTGAVLVFLREARIRNDQELKTISDDDQRNILIVEIGAQTGLGSQLQGLSNMDLVLLGLGKDASFIRGVLLAGKFRTQHELNGMSHDDQRNTLIVELTGRTNQSVGHFQAMDDATLAGTGAVLVFLREARIRNDQELKTMSDDDQRNTLIVEIGAQTGLGSQLQGLSNMDLVRVGLGKNPIINPKPSDPLPETLTLDSGFITSGLSIGGSARLVIARDGQTTFSGHMHNGGLFGIDFLLTVIALDPSGNAYTVQRQGHTAGTFTSGSRDDDWTLTGVNDQVRNKWSEASKSRLSWTLHANDTLTPQLGKALEEALQEALKQAGQAAVKAVIALL